MSSQACGGARPTRVSTKKPLYAYSKSVRGSGGMSARVGESFICMLWRPFSQKRPFSPTRGNEALWVAFFAESARELLHGALPRVRSSHTPRAYHDYRVVLSADSFPYEMWARPPIARRRVPYGPTYGSAKLLLS